MRFTRTHVAAWLITWGSNGSLAALFAFLHFTGVGDGGARDAVLNGALFVAWASLHSLLARPWAQRSAARLVGKEHVRVAYVVVASATLVLLLAAWRPLEGEVWHLTGVAAWGVTGAYVGLVTAMVWTIQLTDYPAFLGVRAMMRRAQGRPPPQSRLVIRGLYGHVRHPLYVLLSVALWTGPTMPWGRVEFAALATVYLIAGSLLEERRLADELGPAYQKYARHVPGWIPRLRPWKPDATTG